MSCFQPNLAVDYGIDSKTGKHRIKFLNMSKYLNLENARSVFGKDLMLLPCGKCVGCAKDYARTWQARIMCESYYHDKACFLTLTYSREPSSMEQVKTDLRKFIKDVRNKYGDGIKFLGCGELGENTKRKHCHLILFGVDFQDDAIIHAKRGLYYTYISPEAQKIWSHGFVDVGTLDVASAGYVSQYCNKKKVKGQDDGEFLIMSRGLGRKYFEDHYQDIFDSDFLYFDGNRFRIPRYFLKLALNSDDFYFKTKVWDYQDRKKEIAVNFRYNSNKSFTLEEMAMIDDKNIKLRELESKEGIRDVGIY